MTIGRDARETGRTVKTIRDCEDIGLIDAPVDPEARPTA